MAAFGLVAALLIPLPVHGVDDAGLAAYEIPLPQDPDHEIAEPAEVQALSLTHPGWQAFIQGEGRGWVATLWSRTTDLPTFAVGPGLPIVGSARPSAEMLEAAARRFIDAHPDLFGVASQDLELVSVTGLERKPKLLFRQTYRGLPVVQAWIHMTFWRGELVAFGSQAYPELQAPTAVAVDAEQAFARAREGLPWDAATDRLVDQRLVVLPVASDGGVSYFLAHEMLLETNDPPGQWRAYVDATDGQLLARYNELPYGTFSGNVSGDVQPHLAQDPYVELPLKDLKVTISGGQTVYTDDNGDFTGSGPDSPTTVTAELWGKYVRVYDDLEGGIDQISTVASPGTPVDLKFDDTNTDVSERDCYYHANVVHDWIKNLDPSFSGMDFSVLCRVNVQGDCCNAFWSGASMSFYDACGGCVDMAQIADVVYHEYHHGITQNTYAPSPAPSSSGMNEAFSDYCGMTIIDSPIIGEGINQGNGFIRTGENLRQYPASECNGEVHCLGEVLMGALWKTRVAFVDKYGHDPGVSALDQLFRETVKAKKYSFYQFLNQMLVEDDDNGNVADGTPNYWEICDAFAIHNLICPELSIYVEVTHTPLEDTPNTVDPYVVTAQIVSVGAGPLDPDSIRVYYSTDGVNYTDVLMSATGNPDEYSAEIPAQPGGTVVDYYIRAVTTDGVVGTHPFRAPEKGVNQFLTGNLSEKLGGGLEDNTGWIEGAPDDDATDGFWEWGDPIGKIHPTTGDTIQPEYDHTPDGVNCYLTRNMGVYWTNGDVDNGKVTLFTPSMSFDQATGGGYLEFWFFMVDWTTPDDTLRVEISGDGTNWHTLAKISSTDPVGYNTWTYRKVYFRPGDFDYSGAVQVRFVAKDNPDNSIHEVAIDDVVVKVYEEGAADVVDGGGVPRRFLVEANRPNPFNPRTTFRYAIPKQMPVAVEVFNVKGQRVRVLEQGPKAPGVYQVVFDGRNDAGQPLPSGLYFARVRAGSEERTLTMTLLK
jgi:Zn-dependent metalloprotease